jgi:extradiol dioxygenase family protein
MSGHSVRTSVHFLLAHQGNSLHLMRKSKEPSMKSLFHLAYHVTDLDEARKFYGDILGCTEGRSTDTWVDFDFFGHQISLHLGKPFETTNTGHVGDHLVPMPHMGVILPLADWLKLADRLEKAGIRFEIPPVVRFKGAAHHVLPRPQRQPDRGQGVCRFRRGFRAIAQ